MRMRKNSQKSLSLKEKKEEALGRPAQRGIPLPDDQSVGAKSGLVASCHYSPSICFAVLRMLS